VRFLLIFTALMFAHSQPGSAEPADVEPFKVNLERVSEAFMLSPHDMALSPDGALLVIADMGNNRVLLLDPEWLTIQGMVGQNELSLPHDVAFDAQGRLLVADSGNDRIAIYRLDGKEASMIDEWRGFDGPEGLAVAPGGRVYVTATLENQLLCLKDGMIEARTDSALGANLDKPHDVEISPNARGHNVIVTDPGNHRLVVFDKKLTPQYEISTWDPPFSEPKYFTQDDQGRLFIADQFNNAIRVFDKNTAPIATFATQHVKLPEGVLVVGDRIWVSDSEGGRVLLYRLIKTH